MIMKNVTINISIDRLTDKIEINGANLEGDLNEKIAEILNKALAAAMDSVKMINQGNQE